MNRTRSVAEILYARPFDMDGLPIRQPFPAPGRRQIDPFILLHHAQVTIPPTTDLASAGVGPHPHKGFSPVTFIFKGGVHHRDSFGNNSIVYAGGTQWMNAGRGIMHSERPPQNIFDLGGAQEIIQLWVNSPSVHKQDEPTYFPLTKDETPKLELDGGRAEIYVQAGSILGQQGAIKTLSSLNAGTLYLKQGATLSIPIPEDHNALIYVLEGSLQFDEQEVQTYHAAVFDNEGSSVHFTASEPTRALLLTGAPIAEPLAMYGPFVMNTEGELKQAFIEYQLGKMGELVE